MNLLLDSNVFVFIVQQPDRLPQRARDAIVDPTNTRYLSHVSNVNGVLPESLSALEVTTSQAA